MEMEIGVWRNLPDEIALNIIARLLPRRSLVRLRTVWKAWHEMLSSYAAMQKIYPNIDLSYKSAFLFQLESSRYGKVQTLVLEGNGDFYKVSDCSDRIEIACNTMFCLSTMSSNNFKKFYVCDEKSRDLKYLPDLRIEDRFIGQAFDSSTDQFTMVVGESPQSVDVYDSSSDSWNNKQLSFEDSCCFWVLGRGVFHRGRFYWLDCLSFKPVVVELNLSDSRWSTISSPHDITCRHYKYEDFPNENVDWDLAGSDVGELFLVDRRHGFMWKLENGEENINSKRWSRVNISLPRRLYLISVNNSGWTVVVDQEEINVYDGSRRLVRKLAMDEVDPDLKRSMKKQFYCKNPYFPPPVSLLPFECTYLWWP